MIKTIHRKALPFGHHVRELFQP